MGYFALPPTNPNLKECIEFINANFQLATIKDENGDITFRPECGYLIDAFIKPLLQAALKAIEENRIDKD